MSTSRPVQLKALSPDLSRTSPEWFDSILLQRRWSCRLQRELLNYDEQNSKSHDIAANIMKWTEDLSVGVELIDYQHRELIARINDLVNAIRQKTCKYKISDVLQFLDEYIVFHFGEEEKIMQKYAYPQYPAHRAQHKEFIANFQKLKKELPKLEGGTKPGSYDLSVETNRVVVDWILEHIAHVDMKLGRFLKDRM
jgi:hemerythrin